MVLTKKDPMEKQFQQNMIACLRSLKEVIDVLKPRTARDVVNIMQHVVTSMQSCLDAADAPLKLREVSTAPRQTGKAIIIGPRPAEANQKTKKKEQKTTKKEK